MVQRCEHCVGGVRFGSFAMFPASLSHVCFSPRAAEKLDMAGGSISADCVAKVKVAGLRFFRENTKREVIADT